MAVHIPTRIVRTGSTGKVQEYNPTTDSIDPRVMPPALPPTWSATTTYTVGNQVFYDGDLYTAIASVSPTTTTPNNDSSNWQRSGVSLQEIRSGANSGLGSRSVTAPSGSGFYRMRFTVNNTTSSSTTPEFVISTDNANPGGSDALLTLNLPPIPTSGGGGGGGVTSGGHGLSVTGTRVDFDYTDPEIIFEIARNASNKVFVRNSGVLESITLTIPDASGTGEVTWYQTFERTSGVLNTITIRTGSVTGTAIATKTFNRTGTTLDGITIS